jgi:hypothetical protein
MAGLVPAIHVLSYRCCKVVDARALTPVFDCLCPRMTTAEKEPINHAPTNFGTTVPFL